jgi:hypothetical protein
MVWYPYVAYVLGALFPYSFGRFNWGERPSVIG